MESDWKLNRGNLINRFPVTFCSFLTAPFFFVELFPAINSVSYYWLVLDYDRGA